MAPSAAPGAPDAPAGPPVHRSYAGLVSRLSALAVDVALLSAATVAVRMLPKIGWSQVIRDDVPQWIDGGAAVLAWLLPWLYFTLCWWLNGQTVGDMLIGVSVRYEDDRDISFFRAAIRAAVGLLMAPLWIVGLVYVLWDRRRRALHDILLGTVVCYTSPPRTALREIRRRRI